MLDISDIVGASTEKSRNNQDSHESTQTRSNSEQKSNLGRGQKKSEQLKPTIVLRDAEVARIRVGSNSKDVNRYCTNLVILIE